jgi:hypothetical protein
MIRFLPKRNTSSKGAIPRSEFKGLSVLVLFVLFWLTGIGVTYRSLNYPWFWDDLHLVRTFTSDELREVFRGDWDVDHIETPGYRPVSVLFNHARASVFGESVVAHRIFQIALVAAYLSILAWIAGKLGMSRPAAALAGVLAVLSKNNWSNLAWLSDGVHALVGLLLIISAYLVISAVSRFAYWKIILAMFSAALALFARDDALAFFPIISTLPLLYALTRDSTALTTAHGKSFLDSLREMWRRRDFPRFVIIVVPLSLTALSVIYWHLRSAFTSAWGIETNFAGWGKHLLWTLLPMGLDPHWRLLSILWVGTFVFLLTWSLFFARSCSRLITFFWFGSVLITTTPGLVEPRTNLLFSAIGFFSFGVAYLLDCVARTSRLALVPVSVVLAMVSTVSVFRNVITQESVHPRSLQFLRDSCHFVWGQWSFARVPPSRIAWLKEEFAKLGINSGSDFEARYPVLEKEAVDQGLSKPNPEGKPFVPRIGFLDP